MVNVPATFMTFISIRCDDDALVVVLNATRLISSIVHVFRLVATVTSVGVVTPVVCVDPLCVMYRKLNCVNPLVKSLFVRPCCAANVTTVSVALGNEIIWSAVCTVLKVVVVLGCANDGSKAIRLGVVNESANLQLVYSSDLFDNKSVVPVPTSVVVAVGSVSVPVLLIVEMIGDIKVLLVNVSVVLVPTRVVVTVGKVMVPPLVITGLAIVGAVSVLLVNVSVDVRATRVSGPVGNVSVPPLVITGLVSVLLVNVSVVLVPTRVVVTVGSVIVFPLLVITGLASVFPVSV